jgi:hypothetical protein
VQIFNELLVQYPVKRQRRPGQVVPDNMVVVCKEPIRASGSFDVPFQPVLPFLVLEYVSKHSKRKDYEDSRDKYERELKVPYYLIFYPDNVEMTLFHLGAKRYVSVKPNANDRYPIPEIDLEVAILDGWVRFWHLEQLLLLPADLQRNLDEVRGQLNRALSRENGLEKRVQDAEKEVAKLRAELERRSDKRT